MEIEVGEYVRTKRGEIHKIIDISYDDENPDYEFYKYYKFENDIGEFEIYILKHSKNIIDLIEVGDIVTTNNLCGEVTKIENNQLYLACSESCNISNVYSILTHEQYSNNSYKVVK